MTTDNKIRLQKWLSQLGIASRRQAETWISEGRVAVNGNIVTELGTKVDPENDRLNIDGKPVHNKAPPKVYWLLHKPDMVLTSRNIDKPDQVTIYDLPKLAKVPFLVSPVGRLDYRTEGLLLLTNDGDLANRLCRPEFKVPRVYQALVGGRLTKEQEQELHRGIELEDGPVKGVEIQHIHGKNLGASKGSWYFVTVQEGRNRLVRRLFEHFGLKTVRLIRVGFGDLKLPEDLTPGDYLQLSSEQVSDLKRSTQTPHPRG